MRFTPLALDIRSDTRVPEEIEGGSRWDVVLKEARVQQDALLSALGQPSLTRPSSEEMQQRQPELDATLASLPDEKQMVLAGIAAAVQNKK